LKRGSRELGTKRQNLSVSVSHSRVPARQKDTRRRGRGHQRSHRRTKDRGVEKSKAAQCATAPGRTLRPFSHATSVSDLPLCSFYHFFLASKCVQHWEKSEVPKERFKK